MDLGQSFDQSLKKFNNGEDSIPADYQQVEYLQSNGTNNSSYTIHINTGVTYFADFEIECMCNVNQPVKFCGNGRYRCLERSGSDGKFRFTRSLTSYYNTTSSIVQKTKLVWKNNAIYINDVFINDFTKDSSAAGTFMLFGTSGDDQVYYSDIRIYYCKLWDTNGGLTRYFIPVYRISDNEKGFYDAVTKTFFTGVGTGEFTAGNNI